MTAPPISLERYLAQHRDFKRSSPDSALPSLYSSLSSLRTSNPAAYAANLEWWRNTLCELTWQGAHRSASTAAPTVASESSKGKERSLAPATPHSVDRLVLRVDESLLDGFTLEDVGRPMGIATVVLDLATSSQLIRLHQFMSSTTPFAGPSKPGQSSRSTFIPSARSVVNFVVGKPLWYALETLGITGGEGANGGADDEADLVQWKAAQGQWVCWNNLETAASTVLARHFSSPLLSPLDSLFTTESFRALVTSAGLEHLSSEIDTRVLLKYLSRDRRLAVVEGGLVKLARSEEEAGQLQPISEDERGLVAVRQTDAKLAAQIEQLERKVAERISSITEALRAKQQSKAMQLLRSKKELEALLDRRLSSKAQLDSVLLKIEQSAGDVELLRAFETSSGVLKSVVKQSGGLDRVESVMRDLEDAVADQEEIEGAMREGHEGVRRAVAQGKGVDVEDEERELEEEMQRLEEEEKERERQRQEQEERARKEREQRREEQERERQRQQERERERQEVAEREKRRRDAEDIEMKSEETAAQQTSSEGVEARAEGKEPVPADQ